MLRKSFVAGFPDSLPMTEQKPAMGGSWWATLPGVLTGLAALLTATGGLLKILDEAKVLRLFSHSDRVLSAPEPSTLPVPQPETPPGPHLGARQGEVDGVKVQILAVRPGPDRSTRALELHYRVVTGPDAFRHDPSNFVAAVSKAGVLAPQQAPSVMYLPPRTRQEVQVIFATDPAPGLSFRFGSSRSLDLPSAEQQ
jgi:hypothetical protein